MGEFLFVTHGTAGDVLPFVRIGAALAARGHAVTLISHAPYADPARAAGLGFAAVDTVAQYEAGQRRTPDLLAARRPHELRDYYEREGLFAQLRREVDLIAERHRPGRTVLVGRHTSALSVLVAADLLAAPAAWVAVAPVQLLVAPVAAAHVRAGLAPGIDAVRAGLGLPPVGDWGGWLHSPRAVLGLWPAWFDASGPRAAAGVTLTGFVTGDPAPSQPWPVAGRPLLVTGGTGQLLHPRFYPVALDAVAATGRPALVVAPARALLPARLPSDVDWQPRLPFPAVLPQVAAILHHGGIGTAVRAMRTGTPQVIMAYGADRPDNAARLAARGAARWVPEPDWAPQAVAAHLEAAAADTGYGARMAGLLDEPEDAAPDRAAATLEELLSAGPRRLTPEQRRVLALRLAARR
ncbi:glycosyltransferase [Dactylosporangium cerinum]|uniref:Glycosyltransferase n=1 Tax=Dactylosporangium cerinum TaxID=1434730 RepID=A0ABV9W4G6_9ACTN